MQYRFYVPSIRTDYLYLLSIQSAELLRQLVDFLLETYLPAPLVPSGMVLLVSVHDKRVEMDRISRRIEERIDYPFVRLQFGPRYPSPFDAVRRQFRLPRRFDGFAEGLEIDVWYDQPTKHEEAVLGLTALIHVDVGNRQIGHTGIGRHFL